ncbi:hypothetical protein [Pseudomonas syringae group genomosp. 3]|uniref:Uncharacterized protein n=1 Tax=Pseudomonas syringae pv. primulae TaxID=251707 RepID=A0A3M3XBC3_9PSED|nr:hypothetical protein [Pseudomonas syringae group genomosp. 3]RMO67265.1 hypothetical protein ALQ36_03442 [Pseudomonas syringae pv. primulae]RMU40822.1 hypothetical protein ALP30_03666 [Pseudomonas syringae pv. primulae]
MSNSHEDESIWRLLFELVRILLGVGGSLLILVGPAVLMTLSPPWWGVIAVIGGAALTGLCSAMKWLRLADNLSVVTSSALLGLALSLGLALPNYWNVLAALVTFVGGLVLIGMWERKLGFVSRADRIAPQSHGSGPSAWGGQQPQTTPEGEPIRTFNMSEIAMGGPVYVSYLFPDGVLLQGIGTSALFSSDGRYFAATVPSRQQWGLIILDRQERRVYRCANDFFWELDEFTETDLRGRVSPLVDNRASSFNLAELLKTAQAVDLIPVADLWLEPDSMPDNLAEPHIEHIGPQTRHRIDGSLRLPDRLRNLEQPLEGLHHPIYQLSLDGRETDLLFHADSAVVWRADGKALCIVARRVNEETARYWTWQPDTGWHALTTPWVVSSRETSLNWDTPLALDNHHLRIEGYLAFEIPDRGRYGYSLNCIHSDFDIQTGHDARGRAQSAERKLTPLQLVTPLAREGADERERGLSDIESEPLLGNLRARLSWQRDNSDDLGGYRCRIGDWALPGLWLLDHRVSDCTRYLALIPFADHPASAAKVVVVDTLKRQCLDSPPMNVVNVLDFREGKLLVTRVAGRLKEDTASTPLQRFDLPAPAVGKAAGFCTYREGSKPYYQTVELAVEDTGMRLLPKWRTVRTPQAANADGDFVQPAPLGSDAAWFFGFETEYAESSWLRSGSGRLGGHLLTASGCALKNLAPSASWSPDARYLALTRMNADMPNTWEVLLLDVEQRTLRTWPYSPGNRPQFEQFDSARLEVRAFESDYEASDSTDQGRVAALKLKALLALPAIALVEQDGLWFMPGQEGDAALWRMLDRSPLACSS